MTGLTLILGLLIPRADAGAIAAAWDNREKSLPSLEMSWRTVRNSRDPEIRTTDRDPSGESSKLRISGRQIRQDGDRLTAMMRDGRTRPAESDPEKARRQFRHVLLEERLAGIQAAPFVETVSSISIIGGASPSRRFGRLEQLLFDVPAWCARPLSLFPERTVVIDEIESSRQSHHICLSAKLPVGLMRTVWVEPVGPYRILRVIDIEPDRGTTQADLQYANDEELFPSFWTVQLLNSAGLPLDFMEVERTSLLVNPVIDEAVFQRPNQKSSDDAALVGPTELVARKFLRSAADASWILLPILWGAVAIAWMRRRRSERSKPADAAPPVESRGKRLILVAAIGTPVIAILPRLPLFDPSMQEAFQRLEAVLEQAHPIGNSQPGASNAIPDLKVLSTEVRQASERRSGIWSAIRKSEPEDESAWRDILRVADSELPTLIRSSGAPNNARERAVRLTLEKVDDHLAGVHPYMPPPKPVLIQTGLEKSEQPGGLSVTMRSLIILAMEIVVALAAWRIWRARRRRHANPPGSIST